MANTSLNTQPIYTSSADTQWIGGASAANTTKDLTSGTAYLAFTASSTGGGYVQRMRFRALGTNVATVARVFINNGGATGTTANNILWDEISLPNTSTAETTAQANYELPLNFALPPSYRIYVTLGTAPNAAGWATTIIGGDY
jgi:hypothetical protein